jgi:cytochrome c oxidase subunit 2
MTLREWLFISWILLTIGTIIIAYIVFLRAGKDPGWASRFRRILLVALLIGLAAGFAASIVVYPYPEFKEKPVAYVMVEGVRFYWAINTTVVPANKPVAFLVTARDVNHGLGIYTSDGRLIAQVQAMPGYINELVITLKPGKYYIACLEYCGFLHHAMITTFEAK